MKLTDVLGRKSLFNRVQQPQPGQEAIAVPATRRKTHYLASTLQYLAVVGVLAVGGAFLVNEFWPYPANSHYFSIGDIQALHSEGQVWDRKARDTQRFEDVRENILKQLREDQINLKEASTQLIPEAKRYRPEYLDGLKKGDSLEERVGRDLVEFLLIRTQLKLYPPETAATAKRLLKELES